MRPSARRPSRGVLFAFIVAACTLLAGGYVALAVVGNPSGRAGDPKARVSARATTIVFQNVRRDKAYAHVAIAPADRPGARKITPLVCERVHYAAGRGLCLMPIRGAFGWKFNAMVFGPDFRVRHEYHLSGMLSRARVSPDGRYGAATGFVSGHSYADADQFSTSTSLIDMASGKLIADLEQFKIADRGQAPRDRNFWGVTFSRDSNRFYATMQTAGKTYLVKGDIARRQLRVLHENVECPSLSPDETRVAYKKRVGPSGDWRLAVLDLQTMHETELAETRNVDDQAEWLDDDHVLYGLEAQVWSVPADGSGHPRRFLSDALSPAVQRQRVAK